MTTCEDEDPDLLTDQDAGQFQPVYAPNGKSIAFVTWKDYEGGHVWRVDAHGGAPERLTDEAGWYRFPAWSPDGSEIVVLKGDINDLRSAEHTSELPSLMRILYSVFCLKNKTQSIIQHPQT